MFSVIPERLKWLQHQAANENKVFVVCLPILQPLFRYHLARLEKLRLLCTLGSGTTWLPIVCLALVGIPMSDDAGARGAHEDMLVNLFLCGTQYLRVAVRARLVFYLVLGDVLWTLGC